MIQVTIKMGIHQVVIGTSRSPLLTVQPRCGPKLRRLECWDIILLDIVGILCSKLPIESLYPHEWFKFCAP